MIDYLTFSLHYKSREEFSNVDKFVQWVVSPFDNVSEKSRVSLFVHGLF